LKLQINFFSFTLLKKTMNQEQSIILTLILGFFISIFMYKNEQFTDTLSNSFSNLFEPNIHSISVECFGDESGTGGYDNGYNTQVHSTGPPVGGTQLANYQLYQQAVNAATPTVTQLENISNLPGGGYGYINTPDAPGLVPPAGKPFYDAAAVDFGNRRAELISPCAQNAPTFVASSLLPKINLPGVPSWQVTDTNALANQDFLSPLQQYGVDTVLSSNKNPSYDLRGDIPNPINVVSPWLNSTITPDLERRPIMAYVPSDGVYGSGINTATYGPNRTVPPLRRM
jgi:hypothetical protein